MTKRKIEVVPYRSLKEIYKSQLIMSGHYTEEEIEEELKAFRPHSN